MSAFRLGLLLVVCACLAVSVRGQSDPTSGCYAPNPSADGPALSDSGFWDINGLESYYSTSYRVLCAYRGYYLSGPAGANVLQYGPWHGNPNDTNCDDGPLLIQWNSPNERGKPGVGAVAYRTNAATGGRVLTSFKIGAWCNNASSNTICAGLCPGTANYDSLYAEVQQDPTYQEYDLSGTAPVSQPSPSPSANARTAAAVSTQPQPQPSADPPVYVITTTNSTQYISGQVTQPISPFKTSIVSAITSVIFCYGQEVLNC